MSASLLRASGSGLANRGVPNGFDGGGGGGLSVFLEVFLVGGGVLCIAWALTVF